MGRMGVDIYPLQVGTSLRHVETLRQVPRRQPGQRRGRRRPARPAQRGDHPHRSRPVRRVPARRVARLRCRRPVRHPRPGPADPGDLLRDLPAGRLPAVLLPAARPRRTCRSMRTSWTSTRSATPTSSGSPSPGCREEPSREATLAALRARGRRGHHRPGPGLPADVLDAPARRPGTGWRRPCRYVTVTVGNLDECETAVGAASLAGGEGAARRAVSISRSSSRARPGVLASDGNSEVEVPPVPVDVVNGLGAGDAFGGALCHALLAGWDLRARYAVLQRRGCDRRVAAGVCGRDADRGRGRGEARRGAGQGGRTVDDARLRELVATRVRAARGRRRGGRQAPPPHIAARRARPADDDRRGPPGPRRPGRGQSPVRHGRPRDLLDRLVPRAVPPRRQRRARHPGHPRGPAAARARSTTRSSSAR